MSRASQKTWLPLERWAEIFGIDPLHFNQLHSPTLQSSDACGEPWFQFSWQDAGKLGREDVARAIYAAEKKISQYVGYHLIPDWRVTETHKTVRPARKELFGNLYNVRSLLKSVETEKFYVLGGGQRAKSLVQADVPVVRTDDDGDGYAETATMLVTTDVEACELYMYFAGKNGADIWEIRPIEIAVAGGVATITCKSWQLADPDQQDGIGAAQMDADIAGSYVRLVDVYRIYNDPSKQVELIWESPNCTACGGSGCTACQVALQDGCLTTRDARLGIVTYEPATWDTVTEDYIAAYLSQDRDPERVRLWYYSGWIDDSLTCPYKQMDPYWELAVAYYAASLLDRETCDCDNVTRFVEHWRQDLAENSRESSFNVSAGQIENIFGTTRGALYARSVCAEEGRRVAR